MGNAWIDADGWGFATLDAVEEVSHSLLNFLEKCFYFE